MPHQSPPSSCLYGIGLVVLATTSIAAIAWCYLSQDWSKQTLQQGISLGMTVLLLSTPGLLYRPNRAAGFGIAAAIVLFLTIFGLGVFAGAIEYLFNIITMPRAP